MPETPIRNAESNKNFSPEEQTLLLRDKKTFYKPDGKLYKIVGDPIIISQLENVKEKMYRIQ